MSLRKTKTIALAATIAVGLVGATAAMADGGFDPSKPKAVPADAIDYVAVNKAISMGTAWGNRGTGAHGTFGTFPANFKTPYHTHTGAYHGVVIEGTMTNPFEDETHPPQMGPGSYWYVPAEMVHATACISDTPCKFFFTADSAFDFKPVDAK